MPCSNDSKTVVIVIIILLIMYNIVFNGSICNSCVLGGLYMTWCLDRSRKSKHQVKTPSQIDEQQITPAVQTTTAAPPQNEPVPIGYKPYKKYMKKVAYPTTPDESQVEEYDNITEDNRHLIDTLFDTGTNTATNKSTRFAHRIGSRDREAQRIQIKARRNNVYEPFFRQELEDGGNQKWWGLNDDLMINKYTAEQRPTIQTGRTQRAYETR